MIRKIISQIVFLPIIILAYFRDRLRYYFCHQFKKKIHVLTPQQLHPGNHEEILAIFAIYQIKALSSLIKRSITYLVKHKIKIMIVAPHTINQEDLLFLEKNHCIVLQRENFGRDFGSYKYGILHLINNSHLLQPFKKILLVNDSIIFPVKELDSQLEIILNCPESVIGLIENYEHHWHIGSYFILFKKEIFLHPNFIYFWKKYKPYSSRFHAINKGEVNLSKMIQKLTNDYKIIYEGKHLLTKLIESSIVNEENFYQFIQLCGDNNPNYKKSFTNRISYSKPNLSLKLIANHIESTSPAHAFALALINYLDCFFIKRDICYRLYSISQMSYFISSINKNQTFAAEVTNDFRKKGIIASDGLLKKILIRIAYYLG